MSIESRLALEILAESNISKHQRRYDVVQRYIKVFGILPHYLQIVRDLPKENYLIEQVTLPVDMQDELADLENSLTLNTDDTTPLHLLDKIYDEAYRLTNSK